MSISFLTFHIVQETKQNKKCPFIVELIEKVEVG